MNEENSAFCSKCGARLGDSSVPVAKLMILNRPGESPEQEIDKLIALESEEEYKGHKANSDKENREIVLQQQVTDIGRDDANDIVIKNEFVSRHHARVIFEDGKFFLEDLNSTNGTFLNGQRVIGKALLDNGYLIKLGRTILRFQIR